MPPTVSIAPASVLEGDLGFADLGFTVTLSEASDQTVIVSGTASGLTATPGDDYTQTIAPLTFLPGETSKLFIVPVHGDALVEGDETLQVALGNPVNAELGDTISAIGTIVDDDSLPAIVSVAPLSIAEGDSGTTTAVFTISLSLPSPQAVTVAVSTSSSTATEGVDFERFNEIVTIPGGETSATIEVLIVGDIALEGDEIFTVGLSNPTNAVLAPLPLAEATILDDDSASRILSVAPASVTEGNAGTANLVFTISLSGVSDVDTTVLASTANGTAVAGSDFNAVAQTVTIPAGQSSTTVAVPVIGDAVLEGNEAFRLVLSQPTGGATISATTGFTAGTILNDDTGTPPAVTGLDLGGDGGANGLAGGAAGDRLAGGGGNDTAAGVEGSDILDGGPGNDLLFGDLPGAGNDSLLGGDGADTALGGDGGDTILGGAGDDFLIGDGGNDIAFGDAGNDVLFGGTAADSLIGGDGVDFLFGEAGADTLDGGADNDRLHVDVADVFVTGGDGIFDVLVPVDGTLTNVQLGNAQNQNAGGAGPVLQGFEAVDASIATAGIAITGAVLNGFGNVLFGSPFADTITGGAGDDILLGNGSADSLNGGDGADTIIADAGNDSLNGGGGADSFFYAGGAQAGAVRIADFVPLDDTILLPSSFASSPAAALGLVAQNGADAVLTLGSGLSITIAGVNVAALTAADFQII